MNRLVSPLQLLLLLLLGLLLAALWLAPGPLAGWRHWQAPQPQAPNLDDVQAAFLQTSPAATADYPELLQRPLFSNTRRPPAPPAARPSPSLPPEKNPLDDVRVQGVLSGPTLQGVMLSAGDQTHFVEVGRQFGNWALETVASDHVVFRLGDKRHRLELPVAPSDAVPAAAGMARGGSQAAAAATAARAAAARGAAWRQAVPPQPAAADSGASADSNRQEEDTMVDETEDESHEPSE